MNGEQLTIKDLARKLNISVSTVSRALRNATDVNSQTRKAVLNLASELNYEPSFIARSLVKKQTNIIGVIVPTIDSNYFSQALCGMTDVANDHGYHVMFCQSNETADQEINSIKKLIASKVDGLLVSVSKESTDPEEFIKIQNRGIPVVMYDRILYDVPCSKVIVDEYEGAYKAVKHLIKKGCKNIAHVAGPNDLSVSVNRLNGYLDALKAHNIPVRQEYIIPCKGFEKDALQAVKKLLRIDPLPDGIFFINDLSAVIALKYLSKKGIHVPQNIRIAGFNDDPISAFIEPSITTVMQPGYEVGKLAMGILIDEIQEKKSANRTISLRTRLIVRDSSK
jgi:DNA-binding LacI/PurR family transcriptional regulator